MFTTIWEQEITFYDLRCALGFKRADEIARPVNVDSRLALPDPHDDEPLTLRMDLVKQDSPDVIRLDSKLIEWVKVGKIGIGEVGCLNAWFEHKRTATVAVEGEACAPE